MKYLKGSSTESRKIISEKIAEGLRRRVDKLLLALYFAPSIFFYV